jgi:hypothetical protein
MDFGMVMNGALDVLADESHQQYRDFHIQWRQRLVKEVQNLETCKPDLVFANVPYLVVAAAKQASIPAIAMCSLNWADIYAPYCGDMEGADEILGQMVFAYNQADNFLCPEPSMNMPAIRQVENIGPVARIGKNRKPELCKALQVSTDCTLVLHTLGGEQNDSLLDEWPHNENFHYLVQDRFTVDRDDVHNLEKMGWDFADLIASSDVFVTKPGYGSFAESVCNGARVMYVRRQDWPEEPYLVDWLKKHAVCEEISREQHDSGEFHDVIERLMQQERRMPKEPVGITDAVKVLEQYLV